MTGAASLAQLTVGAEQHADAGNAGIVVPGADCGDAAMDALHEAYIRIHLQHDPRRHRERRPGQDGGHLSALEQGGERLGRKMRQNGLVIGQHRAASPG